MLNSNRSRAQRRGIVLVLVLAMLGLLAVVGITFATYSGQARINNRNFMQSLYLPQADELLDFALAQVITDTNDIRSAIRGHSMARDMFGNDAINNGYLTFSPTSGLPFAITAVTASLTAPTQYTLTTNIASNDPSFAGYVFTRWIMRVAYTGTLTGGTGTVNQTFEILVDSGFQANPGPTNGFRTFLVNINSADAGGASAPMPTVGPLPPTAPATPAGEPTALFNQTAGLLTQLPGAYLTNASFNANNNNFSLDSRWLHAFNGPGVGVVSSTLTGIPYSYYPNYRYNAAVGVPGPGTIGMDEDYDACDLENWFLAMQSADGQVMIPSFHRPAIIRIDIQNNTNDWTRLNPSGLWADSAARFLRPCRADGHDAATFFDLLPDPATGKIKYDVDNDADGVTDSVWVDLGYPARRDSSGRYFKPLFAFMIIGLNGRIPLNTAGNLAAQVAGVYLPPSSAGATPPGPVLQGGPATAVHLGNSVSEIDPMYALQNAFNPNQAASNDTWAAFSQPQIGVQAGTAAIYPQNSQVDTSGVDVRLTQSRNLMAGTRPQTNFTAPNATTNGDTDYVYYNNGILAQQPYYMPNGIATFGIDAGAVADPNTGLPYLVRSTTPVPGRWGEADAIPGTPYTNPFASAMIPTSQYVNVVSSNYVNPPRAGLSLTIRDIILGLPPDSADDNFNTYDPFPVRSVVEGGVTILGGEVGDLDAYDAAGALIFPVERMRRWVTPADINGTGNVYAWNAGSRGINRGTDAFGRVEFNSYFRPPGSPGVISTNYTVAAGGAVSSSNGSTLGAIYFPSATPATPDPFYTGGPANNAPLQATAIAYPTYLPDMTNNPLHNFESYRFPNQRYYTYNAAATPPAWNSNFSAQNIGGAPVDENADVPPGGAGPPPPTYTGVPVAFPSYDTVVNAMAHSDGLNDADEMNLYALDLQHDAAFGAADIEWLYRQQDVDGTSLASGLSKLAPISFTNSLDGARRRRLFALDTFDLNNFVWTNDNPGGAFPTNSWFLTPTAAIPNPTAIDPFTGLSVSVSNAGFATQTAIAATAGITNPAISFVTPTLGHREKKINLNMPLPVSNDPNEPIRQKWISDTYTLLKSVLPPKAVDTPEELAQLSQYVINIIDFRDPDCTMTHWVNPDVVMAGIPVAPMAVGGAVTVPTTAITLVGAKAGATNPVQLDQWGMEYCPAALNEVLAYSYNYVPAGTTGPPVRWNRFAVEMVNTQTSPELASTSTFNPVLDLGGYEFNPGDPYSGGSWDIIFTADDPYSRPDPYRGQLVPYANLYAATPLNQYSFKPPTTPPTVPNNPAGATPPGTPTDGFDVQLQPLGQNSSIPNPPATLTSPPTDYFYVFGNSPPTGTLAGNAVTYESGAILPTTTYTAGYNSNYYDMPPAAAGAPAAAVQVLKDATSPVNFDPMNGAATPASPVPLYEGVVPGLILAPSTTDPNPNSTMPLPSNYATKLPALATAYGSLYYWVCLRRPANLFAPVSASNPMVVVDAVRFPIMDATGPLNGTSNDTLVKVPIGTTDTPPASIYAGGGLGTVANTPFSVQRYQPYRGGHAVPVPQQLGGAAAVATTPPIQVAVDPRYGYTEQIVVPSINALLPNTTGRGATLGTMGVYYFDTKANNIYYATPQVYHTLGWANEYEQGSGNPEAEPWDYFPFNDRDFTSVAELMLVPGCSPGLFTKQFVEFAPSYSNVANIFSAVQPRLADPATTTTPPSAFAAGSFPLPATGYSPPVNGPPLPIVAPGTVPLEMVLSGVPPSLTPPAAGGTPPTAPLATPFVQAFATASAPLLWYSGYLIQPGGATTVPSAISVPMQPHTFPYLNDQFFYSGYGGAATIDTGQQIGGYSADGWFKMFEFFEVPSQSVGSVGPVAGGANFDWVRQDSKPGQLNLNMIIDEEVFFSLAGKQSINQANTQNTTYDTTTDTTTITAPVDQFSQQLLNFNQIQGLAAGNYTLAASTPANPAFMFALGTSPIPMVVTSTLANGTPATAYPLSSNSFGIVSGGGGGLLASDPIIEYLYEQFTGNTYRAVPYQPPYYNALKAAWVQFLTLRHGGSGYVFGFGTGAVGQNSAVAPATPPQALPPTANSLYATGIPADRPFHSLSYPDIDFTVMRPAALPPSLYTNPVANSAATQINATIIPATITNIYAGDPGVRNPTLYFPYPTANYPGTLPSGTITGTVATPSTGGVIQYNAVLPPAIPTRRLFQPPDLYNPNPGQFPVPTVAPAPPVALAPPPAPLTPRTSNFIFTASNASETGDPYINNLVPSGWTPLLQYNTPGSLQPFVPPAFDNAVGTTYSAIVNNSVVNLYWPTSTLAPTGGATEPGQPSTAAATLILTAAAATTTVAVPLPVNGTNSPILGSNETENLGSAGPPPVNPTSTPDYRQHPYWRSEQMQRIMNLTTTRTHQYAVWITIGFFEVLRKGDLVMFAINPQSAFDIMGPEVGAANGKNTRYRGFYLVDRLKLTGFNPSSPTAFRQAIVYRNRIQ